MNSLWLLVTIGAIISVIGAISYIISFYSKKVKEPLAENIHISIGKLESHAALFFSMSQHSLIRGSIEGEPVPYHIYVIPTLIYNPNKDFPHPLDILNRYAYKLITKKEPTSFECKVPQGGYCLYLERPLNVDFNSKLNLSAEYKEYPHKDLREFGLTLLEVSLPLLITGIVLLSGGAVGFL